MHCFVYKGARKEDHYLYLPKKITLISQGALPSALLDMLGELSLVVEFDLDADRNLPQADAKHVLANLEEQGFYVQLPKKDMRAEEAHYFN